jgi:hypothetical protein
MLEVYHLKDTVVSYVSHSLNGAGREESWNKYRRNKVKKEGDEQKHIKEMIHIEFWWTSTSYGIVLVSYNSKHPCWVSYRSNDESWIYSVMLAITE